MATPTLAQWQHSRVRTVSLASGAGEVEIDPIDLTDLLYGDPENGIEATIPSELATIAAKTEYEGVKPDELDDKERIQLSKLRRWLIADRVRSPKMTPQDVRKLPYEDQVQLFRICLHMDLSERVMLASFREVGGGNEGNGGGPAKKGPAK